MSLEAILRERRASKHTKKILITEVRYPRDK